VKIVAYVPDLMDRSKVAAAADVTFVARPTDLAATATADGADLVVVDVTRPGVVEALPDISVPVLGFSKHTNRDAIDAALAAGAERVLARSAFFARLDDLLADSAPAPETAGSVPERPAGSVPERSTGSVPERNAGSVPERSDGSVPERSDGAGPAESAGR